MRFLKLIFGLCDLLCCDRCEPGVSSAYVSLPVVEVYVLVNVQ